ncbi:MAG: CYTH and CHAD domain-containing protein [Acidimicrobiales bacterium]
MSPAERELKFVAWTGFALPELDGLVEDVSAIPLPARDLHATYYDTSDLRLIRRGITLRHRRGDGDGWTVKLPEGDAGPALVRREISFEGRAGTVPPAAMDLLRAYVRSCRLVPVARLDTRRSPIELRDADSTRLAEVVDDEVSVHEGRRLVGRFREIEVELFDAAPPELADTVASVLRAAGVGDPEPVPKLVRALGPRALQPAEIVAVGLDDNTSTARDAVRAALVGGVIRLLRHDPGVRIGDDPEDLHQARVGARRLRSDLRTFRPLLVPGWADPLDTELRWLGERLGTVRDADVLLDRLRRQADSLTDRDAAGAAALIRRLALQRESARRLLLDAMSSSRYVSLLDALVDASGAPATVDGAEGSARDVLPALVRRPWQHLSRAASAAISAGDEASDDMLHAVRIRAKRCRYAAEAAAPVIGKRARRLARAVAELQTVLGEHQDAVVAEAWLRDAAEDSAAVAVVAGELIAVQRLEILDCRSAWPKAWRTARHRSLRTWLD